MATPNVGILTNAGKNLIDQVNAGKTKITFSKIVFSSMDNSQLSDMQVKALTAIAPQEVVVSSPETTLDTNSGETRIRATGTNEKLADGVYVKTYGVFAKDDTGTEILYGVTVSPNPNYFPAYDGVTPQAVTYSYKTVIQETSNITMTNSNDVYASQEDLTEALQPYAKTVDVNQQLDKKVNIADMRKPASDVAGIEEVNTKQDKIGYTPANDSKVAHLSGANNFDAVPTVKNNPLLLASSLPSDLARTGSDQEFTGKNTFDTAPIDKTTGNPYITKSDVTTAINAATANVVDRNPDTGVVSKPTDFTNLTVNGGKSVATSDDLKSLETSAWRVLDNKCITAFTKYNTSIKVDENSLFLVKIDEVNKRVYMFFTILGNFVENSSIYIDLTSIVKNLSFPSYHLYYLEGNTASSTADGSIVGNRICFKIQIYDTTVLNSKYSSYMVNANDAGWIYSSCFVNYDELV
ncbi:hypothetical protein RIN67_12850 (plasmid) [Levilactobacillus namurensis]|uniref:hypothetical protein n=1 Tax=Levilactobacillus namurensis TaxID=380393 RepID=UPI0028BE1222|nr:hypothetical protein [Levilactobacillus namurensis]WNN66809.1 hypothetical protein RIN67_12850 [Levilactobacillus namurensis]